MQGSEHGRMYGNGRIVGIFWTDFFNGRIGRAVHKDGRMYGFFRSINEIRPSFMDGCTEKCKTFSDQGIKSPKIELFS